MKRHIVVLMTLVSLAIGISCAKKQPPVARPQPPVNSPATTTPPDPPAPPQPVAEPVPVPPVPSADDPLRSGDLDAINRAGALQPVYFELDSSEVSGDGQKTLQNNAQLMKKYGTCQVTIEGHCDERGTPEYNLALGERRALA